MGTMGLPESVLRSMPVLVCTSNIGLRVLKKAGLPQPAYGQQVTLMLQQWFLYTLLLSYLISQAAFWLSKNGHCLKIWTRRQKRWVFCSEKHLRWPASFTDFTNKLPDVQLAFVCAFFANSNALF